MTEKAVVANGAEIMTAATGDPGDPPVLLIMGVMASMLWWPDAFVAALAGAGRYVIRYDNRDTGRSTHWAQGQPGYSFSDMADDAVAVMDGYGFASAHVVGMSMGGMIAQQVALRYPDRVRSLTILSSSPLDVKDLPPSTAAYQEHSAAGEKVDWTNLPEIAAYIGKDVAMIASTRHPHDAGAAADLIAADMARAIDFRSVTNHFMLIEGDPDAPKLRAADIEQPLLVIHGTSDPLFPVEHGEAFARVVRGTTLVRIEGGGHEIHRRDIDEIAAAIIKHTA